MTSSDALRRSDWTALGGAPEAIFQWRLLEARAGNWTPLAAEAAWALLEEMASTFRHDPGTDDATYKGFYAAVAADAELASVFEDVLLGALAAEADPMPADLPARIWAAVQPARQSQRSYIFQGVAAFDPGRVFDLVRSWVAGQLVPMFQAPGAPVFAGATQGGLRGAETSAGAAPAVGDEVVTIGPVQLAVRPVPDTDQVQIVIALVDRAASVRVQFYRGTDDEHALDQSAEAWEIRNEVRLNPEHPSETLEMPRTDLGMYSQIQVIEEQGTGRGT